MNAVKNKLNKELISKRYEIFNSAKDKLKKDFYGIDNVIDNIFDAIETWYIYPEYLSRPTIINLWGLTGVGKTDLVKKLKGYLKIETFISTEMDNSSNTIEDNADYSSHSNNKSLFDLFDQYRVDQKDQSILLLDEIHRYRTIDNDGKLINRRRYNDIWKLLSDGSLYDYSYGLYRINCCIDSLESKYDSVRINSSRNADNLEDKISYMFGNVKVNDERLKEEEKAKNEMLKQNGYLPYEFRKNSLMMTEYNDFTSGSSNILNINQLLYVVSLDEEDLQKLKMYKFIYQGRDDVLLNEIFLMTSEAGNGGLLKYVNSCSNKVMLEFLKYKREKMINVMNGMSDIEIRKENLNYVYSKMLIFICGNIEKEDYNKDNFDIRKHILNLFRPEQVSRFGNNYIVYPVLTKENYDTIIEKEITYSEEMFREEYNTDKISFDHKEIYDKVMKDLPSDYIYNGVRPIFSAVQRAISEVIPNMLINLFDKEA